MKHFLVLIAFLAFGLSPVAQCNFPNTAFASGEKLRYEVYYNWQFVWLNAAWISFNTDDEVYRGKPCFHFSSSGETHIKYDWIFRVRDCYQSWALTEGLQPLKAERKVAEGDFTASDQVIFDLISQQIKAFTQNTNRKLRVDSFPLNRCIFDVLTASYYARTLNFGNCPAGKTFPITMLLDNEVFDLYIRFIGRETINTKQYSNVPCLKFSALLVKGNLFKGGEDIVVWVSDDANKVPVQVEAKILVGSIKAFLCEFSGLRNATVIK